MTNPPPTLLTIPTEIRLQILHYALDDKTLCFHPNILPAYKQGLFSRPTNPLYNGKGCCPSESYLIRRPFYGAKLLSALFLISRQIHDEIEELIYSNHVFFFDAGLRDVINPMSIRAKGLIKEVMIEVIMQRGFVQTDLVRIIYGVELARRPKDDLEFLKQSFPALERVYIKLSFAGHGSVGKFVKTERDVCVELVMDLTDLFSNPVNVVLVNDDTLKPRKAIVDTCRERLAEGVMTGRYGPGSGFEATRKVATVPLSEEESRKYIRINAAT